MELVEGETIAARLKSGPLPVKTAILYATQILAAIAAGEREVSGVVERPVCPISDQARVLIVRMRRNVKDAAEHVQLLERETNLRGIHRLWRLGGIAISCLADIPLIASLGGVVPVGRFLC